MIVTIVAIAIIIINFCAYFGQFLDYVTSEYWMARKISKSIARQDLKSATPDIPDMTASINNTLAVIIVILRIFGVSVEYLAGAIGVFALSAIVFFVSCFFNRYGHLKQIISTVFGTILVIVLCLAI